MLQAIKNIFTNRRSIVTIVVLITIAVSLQRYFLGPQYFNDTAYTHYNNYVIFSDAFHHLVMQQDLYQLYPEEHHDFYKYSPTFALFMGPFAMLPDWLGLILWNMLNALVLVYAIFSLKGLEKRNVWIIWLVLMELITSLQNAQSNALMGGLVILAFSNQEKGKPSWAALLIALSIYIKLFSLAALSLSLLTKDRFKFGAYWIGWMLLLGILPLWVLTPEQLLNQYISWWELLQADHSLLTGISVMGFLQSWFNFSPDKLALALVGAIIYMIPFIRTKRYSDPKFRLQILASVLIWMVIFNHMAESSSYVIAVSGVLIWMFICSRKWYDILLLVLVLTFASITSSDIFPRPLLSNFVEPYVLKAVPCIIVWIRLQFEMMVGLGREV